jgi:two-component system sensor histidine kinase PilS (NtrC family)
MEEIRLRNDSVTDNIRLLILSRLFILTFLLGIALYSEVTVGGGIPGISKSLFLAVICVVYLFSAGYSLFYFYIRDRTINAYIQSFADVLSITALVYGTGGVQSLYSVFYTLVIIYSVTFLGRKGGLLIASLSAALYAFFAVIEYYGYIYPEIIPPINRYQPEIGHVLTRVVTHVLSFYFTALLSIFVVDQERKTRVLLEEKQDAFARLDILYKNIIESVNVGIIAINQEGRIKSFNRAASEMTGLHFREIENQKLSELSPDFFSFLQLQKKNERGTEMLTHFEGVFHTSSGRVLKLGTALSMLRDLDDAVIGEIIIIEDIAEIIDMRESLEKSRRLAFTGEVAANLAHEIRNPLAAIGGSIQLLRQDAADDLNQRLFDIILRGKEQLESFLRDFLLLARPAPGVCEDIELSCTIGEVIDSLRLVPDWRQPLKLELVLPESPVIIKANKTEVRQVLWNLILNALQAMPDGGVLSVEASLLSGDDLIDSVRITIADNGCGIGGVDIQRIFEPFYTTKSAGTGLGLAVVNRIIENWHGRIEISENEGGGAKFTITFPSSVSSSENRDFSEMNEGALHGKNTYSR